MDFKAVLGDAYTPEVEERLKQEVGKHFVSKADFNAKNDSLKGITDQLAERDKQLEELKKSAKGNEELQAQISALQNENATTKADYESKLKASTEQRLLEVALLQHNPISLKALKAELDMEKIKFNGDKVEGLEEQLKAFKESDLKALFKAQAESNQQMQKQQYGIQRLGLPEDKSGGGGDANPFKFDFTPKIKKQGD